MDGQRNSESSRTYEYTPLNNPWLQIRLLEVSCEAAVSNISIKCSLTTWDVETAPPYHAISYTWGAEEPTETIVVDDGQLAVRKNCADVLRQLMYFKTCRYYWLDALCIDQSNMKEKSAQVAIMGDLFYKVEHVLACLGEYDDDGEYAIQMMQERAGNGPPPQKHANHPEICLVYDTIMSINLDQLRENLQDVNIHRFVLSFAAISRRPYFERLWVAQELALARQLSVCCGKAKLPIACLREELAIMSQVLALLERERTYVDQRTVGTLRDVVQPEMLHALSSVEGTWNSQCMHLLMDMTAHHSSTKIPLDRLFHTFSTLKCQDPRDTVYGGLDLGDWKGAPRIIPDYNKPPYNLALEMLNKHISPLEGPQLLWNLQVRKEHPQVRFGLALRRQHAVAILERQTRQPCTLLPRRRVHLKADGRQFIENEHLWKLVRYSEDAGRAGERSDGIVVPRATRPGDWITNTSIFYHVATAQGRLGLGCVVLRKVGSLYTFIGRAIEIGDCTRPPGLESEYLEAPARFELRFDVEDLLVFAATYDELTTQELIETGICSEPYSSFATMEDSSAKPDTSPLFSEPEASTGFEVEESSSHAELGDSA